MKLQIALRGTEQCGIYTLFIEPAEGPHHP